MPSSSADRDPLDLLAEEFVARYRAGERPSLAEYANRLPGQSDEVRDLFSALVEMEQLKPVTADEAGDLPAHIRLSDPLRVGEFRILRRVGVGGMGVVYEAVQESLGRHVALKLLPADAPADPKRLERFRREATSAARLHHTNIVPVFGTGEADGRHYYAMQFIDGHPLDAVIREVRRLKAKPAGKPGTRAVTEVAAAVLTGAFTRASPSVPGAATVTVAPDGPPSATPPPVDRGSTSGISGNLSDGGGSYWATIARLGAQAADALAYAHAQGVLHRDIKPANLLLDLQGVVWVTDFGLAKAAESDDLTQAGDIVGTIRYMAPERFAGTSLPQSDIYALGLTLYELLTLRPAFDETDKGRLIEKVLHETPGAPRKLDARIPRDLETIVLKCLPREPSQRYASAEALADDLRRFLSDRPILARRATVAEQAWRWCRRNPSLAGLVGTGAVLAALVVIGLPLTLLLRAERNEALVNLGRAERAEQEVRRRDDEIKFGAHLAQAHAGRFSHREGQRFESLQAIRQALGLLPSLPEAEQIEQRDKLRDLAIACLTLPDVHSLPDWNGESEKGVGFDVAGENYVLTDTEGNVVVRRLADHREVARFPGDGRKRGALLAPDGSVVLIGRPDLAVEGWELAGHRLLFTIPPGAPAGSWRITRDGRRLVLPRADGTVEVYALPEGRLERRVRLPGGNPGAAARVSPDGNRLAVLTGGYHDVERRTLHVYDLRGERPAVLLSHSDCIHSFAWYPDGKTIVAGGWDNNEIIVWDAPTGKTLQVVKSQKGGAPVVAVNRTGDLLSSTAGWGMGGVRFWHAQTGQELLTLTGYRNFDAPGPDGGLAWYEFNGDKIRLAECAPGNVRRSLVRDLRAEKDKQYHRPSIHPNGRLLAVGMESGVGLWDLPSGREVGFLPIGDTESVVLRQSVLWTYGQQGLLRWPVRTDSPGKFQVGPPESLASGPALRVHMDASEEGDVVAVALGAGAEDRGAQVFHTATPGVALEARPHNDVRDVAVSPDGRFVATCSFNNHGVKVWDAATGKHVADLLPDSRHQFAAFAHGGKWLIVNEHWFEVSTWREVEGVGEWAGGAGIGCMSDDGSLLARFSGEGKIALFNRESGRRLAYLTSPDQGSVMNMTFSPDGTQLVATDSDNLVIHVWDLRKLRAELRELNLDWDSPPYPSAPQANQAPAPPELTVRLGDFEDDLILGASPGREHLRQVVAANTVVLAFNPFNFKAYCQRGRAYGALKEPREAVRDYGLALTLMPADDPGRVGVLSRRAGNYFALGEYRAGVADLRAAEKIDPARGPALRRQHAAVLASRSSDQPTRPGALRAAIEICPEYPKAHNDLAWYFLTGPNEQRNAGEALRHARRAVELAPDRFVYGNTLGVALWRNGQYQEGVAILDKSLASGRGAADAFDLFILAMCHAKLGDQTQAKSCFDRAVAWVGQKQDLDAAERAELSSFRAEAEQVLGTK